jgi:heptosyltransferase-2
VQSPKILIVAPGWVGDLVMSQTLFKLLKQQNPHCIIDVLAADWAVPLLRRMSEVHQIHCLSIKHGVFDLKQRLLIGKKLRQEHYDQAILLPNSFKSAITPFCANIKQRTGWKGEMRWGVLNDVRHLDKMMYPLMIQRFAALGLPKNAKLPANLPWPSLSCIQESVDETLVQLQLQKESKPILAICPGAEYGSAKRWPAQHHAVVAQEKMQEGWDVWLIGGPNDQPIAQEIQSLLSTKAVDLTGRTNLGQAIDLLSVAQVILSNDSGLMHIGAALQKPLVVVYGSSDPRFTPPLAERKTILSLSLPCSPCFQRTCPLTHLKCLNDLHPVKVLHAIDELSFHLSEARGEGLSA